MDAGVLRREFSRNLEMSSGHTSVTPNRTAYATAIEHPKMSAVAVHRFQPFQTDFRL